MAFLKFLVDNAEGVGVVAMSLILASLFIAGVLTERIHIGPEFRRISKRAEVLESTVTTQTTQLTESRVAHAEARVRIEFLEAENKRQRGEIDDLKTGLESVRTELERIRQTWLPPQSSRGQGRRT